jgi:hypothetical protein
MEFLIPEPLARLGAATFRFSSDVRVTARQAVDEDFRPFLVVEFEEAGQVPLRFALPVELGARVWHALGATLAPDAMETRHP